MSLYTLKNRYGGLSVGCSNVGNSAPPVRGVCSGWSVSSAKRNSEFLQSLDVGRIASSDVVVFALSLTIRDCPPSAADWHAVVVRFMRRLERIGFSWLHWVVEWQKRGVPHLHMAVAFPSSVSVIVRSALRLSGGSSVKTESVYSGGAIIALFKPHWLEVAAAYHPSDISQHVVVVNGLGGWFEYMAKHATRGVRHYQRSAIPSGWLKSGRVWGYRGKPPRSPEVEYLLDADAYYVFRRLFYRAWKSSLASRYDAAWAPDSKKRRAWLAEWRYCSGMRRSVDMPSVKCIRRRSQLCGFSVWHFQGITRSGVALLVRVSRALSMGLSSHHSAIIR